MSTATSLYATNPLTLLGTEKIAMDPATGDTGAATAQQIADLGAGNVGRNINALSIASGVVAINCALGDYFTLAATSAMTSFTFSNLPASGKGQTIMVAITQDATGSRAATWPSSFKWAGASAGVLSTAANSVDVLAITTFNQGTSWIATLSKAHA